jgi:YceI-like protein
MRRAIPVTATLVLSAIALPSDAQPRAIDPKRSTVTVRVFKSGLFRAFADDHVIEAPLAEGLLDDSATPNVSIAIDVRDMRVLDPGLSPKDRREVQGRMLGSEVLDADRFPHIRFRSVAIQNSDAARWSIQGELEVHGQTRQVRVNVVRDQGHYKGSTTLKQSEFGITPISIVGGTVKVKDELKIDFDVVRTETVAKHQRALSAEGE